MDSPDKYLQQNIDFKNISYNNFDIRYVVNSSTKLYEFISSKRCIFLNLIGYSPT